MQSTSIRSPLLIQTPSFDPDVRVTSPNRGIEGWQETSWSLKHEEDEPEGHPFNPEPFREGSD